MNRVTIAPCHIDASACALMTASFGAAYAHLNPEKDLGVADLAAFFEAVCQHERDVERDRPEDIAALGAYVAGRLLGLIILDNEGELTYIRQIAVHPSAKRQGIGCALLKHAREIMKNRKFFLVTRRINGTSIKFFTSQGFRVDEAWSHPDYDSRWYVGLVEAG